MGTHEFTTSELQSTLEHVAALLERKNLLPAELAVKLDTWQCDLIAEQEKRDRAEARSKGQNAWPAS